jgi:hypothetical protein
MDKLHIKAAVLSISSPGVHFGDDLKGQTNSRGRVNEEGSRLREAHPGRFGLFAVTPPPNVEMAIEEAVYGDPRVDPFYAELNSHKAAMFIHPTSPSCYGCGVLALGYPGPMLEFMFETTRTVTHLVHRSTRGAALPHRWRPSRTRRPASTRRLSWR